MGQAFGCTDCTRQSVVLEHDEKMEQNLTPLPQQTRIETVEHISNINDFLSLFNNNNQQQEEERNEKILIVGGKKYVINLPKEEEVLLINQNSLEEQLLMDKKIKDLKHQRSKELDEFLLELQEPPDLSINKLFHSQNAAYQSSYHQMRGDSTSNLLTLPQLAVSKRISSSLPKRNLHFAYLFASPLVIYTNNNLLNDEPDEICHKEEFQQIIDALDNEDIGLKYRHQLATVKNLMDCLRQRPIGLHFSGHGLQNKKETFKDAIYYKTVKDNGDVLVFEDEIVGLAYLFFEKELMQILCQYPSDLEFVVVASCHSEQCGQMFRKAGARHVICVDKNNQLNDEAAALFSRTFYTHVFASNFTICKAFEQAKHHVQMKFGSQEAAILKLLVEPGHECSNLQEGEMIQRGSLQNMTPQPELIILPADIKKWISRNKDAYNIIQLLLQEECRVIEVFGFSGVGKSTLIKKIAYYLSDRDIYSGGIIYANLSGQKKLVECLHYIFLKICQSLKQDIDISQIKKLTQDQIMTRLSNIWKPSQKKLLILDNLDDLILHSQKDILSWINNIVQERPNIQIIFSSSVYLGRLDYFTVKNLKGLSQKKALELFLSRIPFEDDKKKIYNRTELEKLHEFTVENDPTLVGTLKLCKKPCTISSHKQGIEQCINFYLSKHPLFQIVNQPLSLCMIAGLMTSNSLLEIYKMLISDKLFQEQGDALILSIDYTVSTMASQEPKAIEILNLIGQTHNGLDIEDLNSFFWSKNIDIQALLTKLEEASLISYDSDSQCYRVENLVKKYVQERMKKNEKLNIFHQLISYYQRKIWQLKQQVSNGEIDLIQLIHFIDKNDFNIIHCINSVIKQTGHASSVKESDNGFIEMHYKEMDLNRKRNTFTSKGQFMKEKHNFLQPPTQMFGAQQISVTEQSKNQSPQYTHQDSLHNQSSGLFQKSETQTFGKPTTQDGNGEYDDTFRKVGEKNIQIEIEKFDKESEDDFFTVITKKKLTLQHGYSAKAVCDDEIEDWEIQRYGNVVKKLSTFKSRLLEVKIDGKRRQSEQKKKQKALLMNRPSYAVKKHQSVNLDFKERLHNQAGNYQNDYVILPSLRNQRSSSFEFINKSIIEANEDEENEQLSENCIRNQVIREEELKNQTEGPREQRQYDPGNELNFDGGDDDEIHEYDAPLDEFWSDQNEKERILQEMIYSYLKVQALKKDNIEFFLGQFDKFSTIISSDSLFEGKIKLLLVYQFLIDSNYQSALNELKSVEELFNKYESKKALAISNYFYGFIFFKLKKNTQQKKIVEYLQRSEDQFKEENDIDGIQHCKELLQQVMNQRFSTLQKNVSDGKRPHFNTTGRLRLDRLRDSFNLLLNGF